MSRPAIVSATAPDDDDDDDYHAIGLLVMTRCLPRRHDNHNTMVIMLRMRSIRGAANQSTQLVSVLRICTACISYCIAASHS